MVTLAELPPPPPGKTGWLWTQASVPLPAERLPRITIVTPSYNQALFIEETIRSVLLQGYPDLEYIIIDGGSADGSVEIIRKYERWLAAWVSEPDHGQADAINKGFARATGDIVAWLNSDDRYLPNAFAEIARAFAQNPSAGMVFGNMEIVLDGRARAIGYAARGDRLLRDLVFPFQPTCFFKRAVIERVGLLDATLRYVLDVDFILRVMANFDYVFVPAALASFRVHSESKTGMAEEHFARELLSMLDRVLAKRDHYPKLNDWRVDEIRCVFYRRASKHLYMGNRFAESLRMICRAVAARPAAALTIAQDEGIGWLVRRLTPPGVYRSISASYRARN